MTLLFAILFAISVDAGRTRAANRPSMPAPSATAVDGPWSIEIVTTGGIAGGGFGDMRADSTGKLVVGQFVSYGIHCEVTLTPSEVEELATLVRSLRADLWYSSYLPADQRAWCCDRFFTTVKLERQERNPATGQSETVLYTTQFLSEQTMPPVARDLNAFVRQLWSRSEPSSLFNRYLLPCRATP